MDNLGLNNDVLVGGRKFHIQTSYSATHHTISGKVFNEGEVVDSKDVAVEPSLPQAEIRHRLEEVHQQLITEMEVLYYINEKVRTVKHAPSANKLGLLFLQKKLVSEAIEHFKLALDLDPTYSEVFVNLGKAYLLEEAFDDAIDILERGVQQAPQYADLQNYLGIAYLYKEKFDRAVQHLQEALSLNQNYLGAQYHLGVARLAKFTDTENGGEQAINGQLQEALDMLEEARQKAVNHDIPHFDKVMQLVQEKAYKEAVDEFLLSKPRETLKQFSDIENEFYLKFMYGGKGKDDGYISEYVEQLKEILRKHPDYADVRNNLGVANLIQCRNLFLKSLEEFRTALKINPNFKKAEKNLKLAENDGKGFLILLRAILK